MKKEFVMRGQTASGGTEKLSFSGHKDGYAYRMTEFILYPSTGIGSNEIELCGSVTAAKGFEDPENPNFNNEGLIATAMFTTHDNPAYPTSPNFSVVNDTFLITQDLILAVTDTKAGSPQPANWQCRFEAVKMSTAELAVTNYRQFMISDG